MPELPITTLIICTGCGYIVASDDEHDHSRWCEGGRVRYVPEAEVKRLRDLLREAETVVGRVWLHTDDHAHWNLARRMREAIHGG